MRQDVLRNSLLKYSFRHGLWASASLLAIVAANHPAHAQDATPVPPVTVTAPANQPAQGGSTAVAGSTAPEGSEAAGYKPTTFPDFGPFGQVPILDIPYSVNVMSSALLENTLSSTQDDIYRLNPLIQPWTPVGRGGEANFTARGFNLPSDSGRSEDGMRVGSSNAMPLEDKERVEYISGLTSFLYGATDVGGLLNYVYKRPTATPLANVTIGDYGNSAGFAHGDFGGPIDKEGQFGYRLNIVGQTGDLPVDYQQNQRYLFSGALSWHINNDTLLEFLASHEYMRFSGVVPFWSFATNANGSSLAIHPAAPNPANDFAQPWEHYDNQTDRAAVDFSSKLNESFTFRASYAYINDDTPYASGSTNIVSNNTGQYSQVSFRSVRQDNIINTGYVFLDADFNIYSVHNKLTAGFYANTLQARYADQATPVIFLPGFNFQNPMYVVQPTDFGPATGPLYTQYSEANTNYILGDEIRFNEYLSALVGADYASVKENEFDTTVGSAHSLISAYNKAQLTPTLSLIGKPTPWLSTYFTYSESLQQGAIVPLTGPVIYTNAGQVFAPVLGSQYEVGAKADVHGILLTAALFRINKALDVTIANPNGTQTISQDGRQINSGLELTATGNVWEGFRIYGGMTLLDPRVSQYQANPLVDGKQPQNVADILAKVTAEYDLPFAPGLTLTGGVYYTGAQAVDILNTEFLPPFTTEDLGLRYRGKLPTGQEAVFRFIVSNLTNKHYWLDSYYVGAPRSVAMSAQIKF